jgi:hypothetical protein
MGGAQRAIADGIDAISLNPAGMAQSKRYLITLDYAWSQDANAHRPQLGVLDSQTTQVATGLSYSFERRVNSGNLDVHRVHFALGYNIGMLSVGLAGKFTTGARQQVRADLVPAQNGLYTGFNADVGLMLTPIPYLSLAVVGYNLVPTLEARELTPLAMAVALAGHVAGLEIGADAVLDFVSRGHLLTRWHFGAEYAVGNVVPLRAGFIYDRVGDDMFWTLGIGFQQTSFGLDFGYRQGVARQDNRTLALSLRFGLN